MGTAAFRGWSWPTVVVALALFLVVLPPALPSRFAVAADLCVLGGGGNATPVSGALRIHDIQLT
jgi:hypothetical protein